MLHHFFRENGFGKNDAKTLRLDESFGQIVVCCLVNYPVDKIKRVRVSGPNKKPCGASI